MKLFATDLRLAEQFPKSKLIYREQLDDRSKSLVKTLEQQKSLATAGLVGYPTVGRFFIKKPLYTIAGCMTVHVAVAKAVQQLLLKRLSKGKMAGGISHADMARDYTHMIVDLKGNVLFVNEETPGALKRHLTNFYLAKVKLTAPKTSNSAPYRLLRAAQRRLWPNRARALNS